jgi:hypothetical protein
VRKAVSDNIHSAEAGTDKCPMAVITSTCTVVAGR